MGRGPTQVLRQEAAGWMVVEFKGRVLGLEIWIWRQLTHRSKVSGRDPPREGTEGRRKGSCYRLNCAPPPKFIC